MHKTRIRKTARLARLIDDLVLAECQKVTHQMLAYAQLGPLNTGLLSPISARVN